MSHRTFLAALVALLLPSFGFAQSTGTPIVPGYNTTVSCPGNRPSCWVPYDTTGAGIPIQGAFSASISGFTQGATGTPITAVVAPGATGNLPAGAVVVATNTGANNAFCKPGATATASDQVIAAGGGWFAFTVGAATQMTCLTASGSTIINLVGGAGLPTGAGGAPTVSAGSFNNNADGVATSADNGKSAAWLYGFNGTTYDRLSDGIAASNPAHPLATQMMVSDNTNLQRVLTPLNLADGVNGNNMVSVGSWMWNGVTWDRVRGAAATGLTVRASNLPTTVDTNAGAAGASTIRVVTATNSPVNVAQFGGTNAVTGGVNGSVGVGGLAASGAAVAGNPLLTGCRAATTIPTAVTDGQAVPVECGANGKVTVIPYSIKENATGGGNVTITGSGAQTIIAASGVAGVLTYVTSLQCNNTGTAAVTVLANDAWTSNFIVPPAGGTNLTFPVPLRTAANTAFTLTGSAGGTGGTITCNAQGYKGN